MSPKYLNVDAIDFRYLLLDAYKKMDISEQEVMVILMIDHLLKDGNDFITPDLLALKMTLSTKEIDNVMASLMKKEFLTYETVDGKMVTSLNPIKTKLYKQLQAAMEKDRANLHSAERSAILNRLYPYFEKRLNRTLSPLENDAIIGWLDDAYSEEDIRNALEDALAQRKRSFKSIDKLLRVARSKADIAQEGYTGVNGKWDKDIAHTIEIARTKWIDDEEE